MAGQGGFFFSITVAGREGDHPPPSGAKVKNACNCTPTPPCLHGTVLN
jgi:hypothetical protein